MPNHKITTETWTKILTEGQSKKWLLNHKSRRYCVNSFEQRHCSKGETSWTMHTNPMHWKDFSVKNLDKIFSRKFLMNFSTKNIEEPAESIWASSCSSKLFCDKSVTKSCYRIKKSFGKYKKAVRRNRNQRFQTCKVPIQNRTSVRIDISLVNNLTNRFPTEW